MTPARPLKDVFADLLGGGGVRPDADAVLADAGHGDLPADLVAEAVVSYADTVPVEVAEHLAPYVTAHSGVPLEAVPDEGASDAEPAGWADLLATAPAVDADLDGLDERGDGWDEIDDDGNDLDGDGEPDDVAVFHFGGGAGAGLVADDAGGVDAAQGPDGPDLDVPADVDPTDPFDAGSPAAAVFDDGSADDDGGDDRDLDDDPAGLDG
jgi:hypothetical protein